jgi:prepilin-type N-terminal cleavage/methylation domain-containing protein/prepilin-type processing-associated H-X9-DG protein
MFHSTGRSRRLPRRSEAKAGEAAPTFRSKKSLHALTLIELLVVLAVALIFAALFFGLNGQPAAVLRARRVTCLFNLKQIGLAENSWAADHAGNFPMQVSETNGGTMEFTTGTNAFRHFQVLSNYLSWTLNLHCPSDQPRFSENTNFALLNNFNLSYFVSLDATKGSKQVLLSGDRNLTDGVPLKNGIMSVTANRPVKWTAELHNKAGNILLADGSAQQVDTTALQSNIVSAGAFTNHLLMPILGP